MMNTRKKGQRTFAKALAYAKATFPHSVYIPMYQVSRWTQSQPFDLLLLELDQPAYLIEVRTGQWGISKPQTRQLAALPGYVTKQIWRFRRGWRVPEIREWRGTRWEHQTCRRGASWDEDGGASSERTEAEGVKGNSNGT